MLKTPARRPLYYGWVMLSAISVTELVSFGILFYAFTVFIGPMQAETGWSRADLTGAFSLALVVSGVSGVPIGRWLDRHGIRLLMTTGSILATLLLLAWSAVKDLTMFYLIWFGLGLTMSMVLYDPAFVMVAVWFRRKRGRALTILTFVAGFASVIFIPLADWLVKLQGWRGALVTLALILGIITIPLHGLLLRHKPQDLNLLPDGEVSQPNLEIIPPPSEDSLTVKQVMRMASFWWLTLAFSLNTVGTLAVSVHLVPHLTDQGFDSGFAASMGGLIGVAALPGRLIFNIMAEKVRRSVLTGFIFLLQAFSLVLLLIVPSIPGVLAFVLLFGAGFGAVTPLRAGLLAELYGPAHYGRIAGFMGLFFTIARGIGPLGAGLIHDIYGNYSPAFWAVVVVSGLSAGAVVRVERK